MQEKSTKGYHFTWDSLRPKKKPNKRKGISMEPRGCAKFKEDAEVKYECCINCHQCDASFVTKYRMEEYYVCCRGL